ncbi:MAG: DUF4845 domain-containing protein [Betaproteobacteria bacterium]|nr:DUF4845 domain-containing protein [Betaproteobacteria bacterium]
MHKQRGVSLTGLIVWLVIGIFVILLAFKLGPAYMEYSAIKTQFKILANDPSLMGVARREVEGAFAKRAMMEDIRSIGPADLQIVREGDQVIISSEYSVRVPLFGNISACLEFNPTSGK